MRTKLLTLLIVVAAVFAIGARPASANHLDDANVTEDCTGYTIGVDGIVFPPNAAVNYSITITPSIGTPGSAQTILGSILVPPSADGTFKLSVTKTWAEVGVTLNGTYCFSGSATLTANSGADTYNTLTMFFTPGCITCQNTCSGTIGNFVWRDSDCNGHQDVNEPGISGVTVSLLNSSDVVIATTTTDSNGYYQFIGLCAGTYTVVVNDTTLPSGYVAGPCRVGDPASDNNCSPSGTMLTSNSSTDQTMDFGYCPVTVPCTGNCISLTKTAGVASTDANKPVTYTYTVRNTGTVAISNGKIVDDNGTRDFTGDDFVVADNIFLSVGQSLTFTATVIPSAPYCAPVNGVNQQVGTLSLQILPGGDVKLIYRQSLDLVDNTYGANKSAGWAVKGHTFSNLTGSDKAQFVFKNGAGATVLDAYFDYISASSAFPSGYGTLGATGGDGKLNSGSLANILSVDTTFSNTLNKPQFRTGYTVNSAAAPNADWEYVDGYTVVISRNAFGTSGFGSVVLAEVHNSPAKIGDNAVAPIACSADTINTATVTATAGALAVSASDDATVHINAGTSGGPATCTNPDPRTGKCKTKTKN